MRATYAIASAAAQDAGDRSAHAAGRSVWSEADADAAERVFDALYWATPSGEDSPAGATTPPSAAGGAKETPAASP